MWVQNGEPARLFQDLCPLGVMSADRCIQSGNESNCFLLQIVIGDETWVHQYTPKSKWQLIEWHQIISARKKKFKSVPPAGKIMATVFWDLFSCELFA
jgi:hypothetical protein